MSIRRTTWAIAAIVCIDCIGVSLAHAAEAKPERPLSQVGRYVPHPLAGGGYAAMDYDERTTLVLERQSVEQDGRANR